jgi:hypothetical protein
MCFDRNTSHFASLDELKESLKERYGKLPKRNGRNAVYVDTKEGKSERIGFTYSFWNRDISHDSKSWFQTDWITVSRIEEMVILI